MQDRLIEVLSNQRADLLKALAMMETGVMSTRTNGKDTTDETIAQYRVWVDELSAAIQRHEMRNA